MGRHKKVITEEQSQEIAEDLHIASIEDVLAERARAPHEPTEKERVRLDALKKMEEAETLEEQKKADTTKKVDVTEMKDVNGRPIRNPRVNPALDHKGEVDEARKDRRRTRIWETREKFGLRQRRKIYTPDGKDTGATTSAF